MQLLNNLFGVMFITGRKEWLTISDEKSQEIQGSTLFCKEIYTCFSKKDSMEIKLTVIISG